MKLERTKNTKRNIVTGEIDKILGVLLPFAVRTMIIRLIGLEYLGLTGLIYSILQMLNLAELGFGTAIIYSIYKPIADNDTGAINALLSYYVRIYRIVGCIVTGLGLAVMPFLRYFIRGSVPAGLNVYLLYLIYLVNAGISFFVYPEKKALLSAYQRDDVSGRIHIFTQFGMYAAQAGCIVLTKNYYLYALMMPVTSVIFSLICAVRADRLYPAYRGGGLPDEATVRNIRKQVGGIMIRKIAMLSRNAFDSIFISAYLGLGMVAVYSNYYYIMDSVVMILAVVKTSMAGGVGNSIAMETEEKNLRDMHRINFLFMWLSGWFAVCLLCLYQPFMKLWVGEKMTLPSGIAVMFAVYFYVLKMSDIRTMYAEAAGIWWEARYISLAEAAANLLMNWIFIRFWGLYGIILATLISYFVFNFLGGAIILFRNYFIHGGLQDYLLTNVRYALVTLAVAAATYAVTVHIGMDGPAGFAVRLLCCALLPNALYFILYRHTADYRDSRPLIEKVLRKR